MSPAKPKTKFQGGGRGSKTGSVIVVPAKRDKAGRIITPEKVYTRVRRNGHEKKRIVETRTDGKSKQHDLIDEFKHDRLAVITPASHTFEDLAKYYEKQYLKPARYVAGARVEGLKSWKNLKKLLKVLSAEFGQEPLYAIDFKRILRFKEQRLKTPVVVTRSPGKIAAGDVVTRPRGITGLNRELRLLHHMLEVARLAPLNWISRNPFTDGRKLIQKSLEQERMVILTHDEERRLLKQCTGLRAHLELAFIWAIDTAMRPEEQFTTAEADVHVSDRYIRIVSYSAKLERQRLVPMSDRLVRAYQKHLKSRNGAAPLRKSKIDKRPLVFDQDRMKRAWTTARRLAKVSCRWQDLRHTGIMRMLEAGVDPATVMKITGHTNWTTFMRYVNLNPELVRGVADKLDASRSKKKRTRAA